MCGGDSQFMHDFIKLFTDTMPSNIRQLRFLQKSRDWTEIADLLHKIKPTVELFGMMHIHGEIKLAEHAGKTGRDLDRMDGWLDHILSNLEVDIKALEKEIPKYL